MSAPRPTTRGTDRDPLCGSTRGTTRGSTGNRAHRGTITSDDTLTAGKTIAGITLPSPNDGDFHVFATGFAQ